MKAISALVAFLLLFFAFAKPTFAAIAFTIANPTISINDEIEVDASISGLISSSCSTSGCYLQAELRTLDETKGFFGFTHNNSGEYVDYFSLPSSVDELKSKLFNFIPISGAWSGKLQLKNNPESTNYAGPGQYAVKFRRFSGNSTGATSGDSNTLTIILTLAQPTSTPTPTSNSTSSPQNTPISSPIPTRSTSPTSKPLTPAPSVLFNNKSSEEAVLGESSDRSILNFSSTPSSIQDPKRKEIVLSSKADNVAKILIGLGFVFILACGILFFWPHIRNKLKKNE